MVMSPTIPCTLGQCKIGAPFYITSEMDQLGGVRTLCARYAERKRAFFICLKKKNVVLCVKTCACAPWMWPSKNKYKRAPNFELFDHLSRFVFFFASKFQSINELKDLYKRIKRPDAVMKKLHAW